MWKHLDHPNILPLLGVTLSPHQLISSWMPGGNLRKYVRANPGADRLKLVRAILPVTIRVSRLFVHQLHDAAKGLNYLHSRNVIHGDLKGVRDCLEPRFTDILTPPRSTSSWTLLMATLVHAWRISELLWSPGTWIPYGAPQARGPTLRSGLRQRSWRGEPILAGNRIFSLSRW